MTTAKNIFTGLLVAVALVVAGFLVGHSNVRSAPTAGAAAAPVGYLQQLVSWFSNTMYYGSSQQTSVSATGAVTIGSSGNAVATLAWSNCSLIATSFTVAASTTVPMDCALSGAQPSDFVIAQFGTSTVPVAGSWRIVGASASSTSGFDTLQIRNDTGASAIIPAQIASSTRLLNIR